MDSGNFNVSISIKIKTNNDNQFLISKYGFFKFFFNVSRDSKINLFTECRSFTLTEFFYC